MKSLCCLLGNKGMSVLLQCYLLVEGGRGGVTDIGDGSLTQAWGTAESQMGRSTICKSAELRVWLSRSPLGSLRGIMPDPAGPASVSASDQAWMPSREPTESSSPAHDPVLACVVLMMPLFTSPCSAAAVGAASLPSTLFRFLQTLTLLFWPHCVCLLLKKT